MKDMFLVQNFMLNLKKFKDFIYNEWFLRNKSKIELTYEQIPNINKACLVT